MPPRRAVGQRSPGVCRDARSRVVAAAAVASGRVAPNGNPILTWMAGRCAVRQDHNEHIVPTKKKSTGRIDGIVASIIGLRRALDDGGRSISETRIAGVVVIGVALGERVRNGFCTCSASNIAYAHTFWVSSRERVCT
ncbi:MAG: terminase TerL endonuclease subunit [Pirellulales bacterium]